MTYKTSRHILMRMQRDKERIILSSPDILNETHLPPEIVSRDQQIKEIGTCLSPITEGRKPINCWFYGKSGTGKTATTRWILQRLESKAGILSVYVNCWENLSCFSVLDCIARELRMLGADNLSMSFMLERLKQHISSDPLIIVLDEIDQLPPKARNAILYNLSELPIAGLVCICNSHHVYYDLEERVKSRLNPARIQFDLYSQDELFLLLFQRVQDALVPETYIEDVLNEILKITDLVNSFNNVFHLFFLTDVRRVPDKFFTVPVVPTFRIAFVAFGIFG